MRLHILTSALIFLGITNPAQARDLFIDAEVLHLNGLLAPSELTTMLASPELKIEAHYQPTRLVDGVTARRERSMPIGSKLFAIPQQTDLMGAQIERKGLTLHFRVSETHPAHTSYQLQSVMLRVPVAPGPGRPQPDLQIGLLDQIQKTGSHEMAALNFQGTIEMGMRLRYRWSDTPASTLPAMNPTRCQPDIHALGNGQYRFRPRHPLAGLFKAPLDQAISKENKASFVQKKLVNPYPEPLKDWTLINNSLMQLQIAGQAVEQIGIYAEQKGAGACQRTRSYSALFANGQAVAITRAITEQECTATIDYDSSSVEAQWLENGSLATYIESASRGSKSWDGFAANAAPCAETNSPPKSAEVEALKREMQKLRSGFIRN